MQKSFVLNSTAPVEIGLPAGARNGKPGVFLDPDYSGTLLFYKDGVEVPTDFKTVFERVHSPAPYDYFSFYNPDTGESALVHVEILRNVVADALHRSMEETASETGNSRESTLVQEIAVGHLFK